MSIELVEVDVNHTPHCRLLYRLLEERLPEQSISHKEMPGWDAHVAFIQSKPYRAWYLIKHSERLVGSAYLTRQNEIGIAIFEKCRGNGFAHAAIKELMKQHDGPFLANINPGNWASRCLFDRLGFKFIQVTYSHD
jgi:RimJ/RimL family protein N-acetyltransferase